MNACDIDYIKRLAASDHEAFRYLFMKYYPKVKCFISRIVKSEAIAEELSQDIFEKIWRNRATLPALHSFSSYLYKMAKNIAINFIERKYMESAYLQHYDGRQDASIDEELDAKEVELLIMLEVEKMPEQRKKIFTMSRFDSMKNNEIAEKLNITKKTVENHLNLALKQIRSKLKRV